MPEAMLPASPSRVSRLRGPLATIALAGTGAVLAFVSTKRERRDTTRDLAAVAQTVALGEHSGKDPRAVPAFVVPRHEEIETRPSSPGYDPVTLGMAVSPRKLFDQEPRNEAWASGMEERLLKRVESDLVRVPGTTDLKVECRTTGCKFSWVCTDKQADFIASRLMGALWGGGIGAGFQNNRIEFFRGPRFSGIDPGDPEQLFQRLRERRQDGIRKHRGLYAAGRPRYKDMPLEFWPEE